MMDRPTFFLARVCRRWGWNRAGLALAALAGIFKVYGVAGSVKVVRELKREQAERLEEANG